MDLSRKEIAKEQDARRFSTTTLTFDQVFEKKEAKARTL
jgi:hypothetical protein